MCPIVADQCCTCKNEGIFDNLVRCPDCRELYCGTCYEEHLDNARRCDSQTGAD